MNDLAGLNWSSGPSKADPGPPNPPIRATPSPTPSTAAKGKDDTFANLLGPKQTKSQQVSLQERQRQLVADRSKQSLGQKQNGYNSQDWDILESGRGTPVSADSNRATPLRNDDDILAAFNASAPVDSSSHFPPPKSSQAPSGTSTPGVSQGPATNGNVLSIEDDDDPFGLGQQIPRRSIQQHPPAPEDDDILGDLAKPVSETAAKRAQEGRSQAKNHSTQAASFDDPRDKAIAELLDMGFEVERAQDALAQTSNGSDIQAAISILLNQAHEDSHGKSKPRPRTQRAASSSDKRNRRGTGSAAEDAVPPWMKKSQRQYKGDAQSPASEEKDVAQYATEFGNSVFKSANMLWKEGQKRMQKAVADLAHEGESGQPRWMREAQLQAQDEQPDSRKATQDKQAKPQEPLPGMTNEAMLLDTDRPPPRPRKTSSANQRRSSNDSNPTRSASARPYPAQQMPAPSPPNRPSSRPTERLNKKFVEEETAQAYVSPARRKKAPPEPAETAPAAPPEHSLDIFSSTQEPPPSTQPRAPPTTKSSQPQRSPTPLLTRPKAVPRTAPSVPASVLASSASHRQSGAAAYKRGDYASAHASYTAALQPLPSTHPITIVLHCNRALTSLKTGDAKSTIVDADAALSTIGPSLGDGESISLGPGDSDQKPMREFYSKAIMRKAEALEHLEKWSEAAKVWRQAVENGVGGSNAIQARNRCEKAAGAGPAFNTSTGTARKPAPAKRPPPPKPKPSSALAELGGGAGGASEAEAVTRLRAANDAAAAASDEAFALTDKVEAKLTEWKKGGKGDNLRALLASLEGVLWEDAGWKKVGMGDLVMPGRVKVVYMKAIGKVHPDKLPQDANTEKKMISAAVFATLNEAWDKFKKDNNL
ncbi:MAG: hypothetical protein M1831_002436 [Alyxoria varia]|nr:MAG: hypothetical protein M1831_002436 [Alyxoria varia]